MKFKLTEYGRELCRDKVFSFKYANSARSKEGADVVKMSIDDVIECKDEVGCRMLENMPSPRGLMLNGDEKKSGPIFERTRDKATLTVE